MPFEIGNRVRIKANAFPDSDEPQDIAARGKEGIVAFSFGENDVYHPSWEGCYEIEIGDDIFLVVADEIEMIQD